jgi:hypothetical protein
MRTIYLISSLETADDGNTTWYGGSFTLVDGENSIHTYYRGCDRSNTATSCIEEALNNHFNVVVPEEQDLMIDNFIYNDRYLNNVRVTKKLALRVDDEGVVTCVEPVSFKECQ